MPSLARTTDMGRDLWIALRASDGAPQDITGPLRRSLAAARRIRLTYPMTTQDWPGEQRQVCIDSNGDIVAAREACSVIAHFQLQQLSYYCALVTVTYHSANHDTQFLLAHWSNANRCWQPTTCSFRLPRRADELPDGSRADSSSVMGSRSGTRAAVTGAVSGVNYRRGASSRDNAVGESASDSDLTEGGL